MLMIRQMAADGAPPEFSLEALAAVVTPAAGELFWRSLEWCIAPGQPLHA